MGRLIDADKLLETLQDLEPHCENKDYEYGMLNTMRYYMPKIINDEPTVFDVEKVVEWLKELKTIKSDGFTDDLLNMGFTKGYNKAIDDFVEFASTMPTVEQKDGTIRPMWLKEMAEHLKEGGK